MTTYKFKLSNNNSNNTIYNNSYADELKSIIANNIAAKNPWLNPKKTKSSTIIFNSIKPSYTNLGWFNIDSDYKTAIKILDSYAAKKYNKKYLTFSDGIDEYDFEIDGTPIRIFDDMIQIGNRMFSKNASKDYYINLEPSFKKIIIDIIIKIKH